MILDPEFVSDEQSLGIFLLVSVLLGGGAAWLAGRAIAATWRPWWHVALYMVILSFGVRFLHFALSTASSLTLHYYLVDYAVCLDWACSAFGLRGSPRWSAAMSGSTSARSLLRCAGATMRRCRTPKSG